MGRHPLLSGRPPLRAAGVLPLISFFRRIGRLQFHCPRDSKLWLPKNRMGGILQTMTHQRHPKALDGFADDSIFGHTSIFPHHEPFAHKMKFLMGVAWQVAMGKEVLVLLAPPGKCNQRNVLNLKLQLSVGWWFLYTPTNISVDLVWRAHSPLWFPGCQVRAYSKAGMGPWSVSSDAMQAACWGSDGTCHFMLCNFHEETIYIILCTLW